MEPSQILQEVPILHGHDDSLSIQRHIDDLVGVSNLCFWSALGLLLNYPRRSKSSMYPKCIFWCWRL